MSDTTSLSGIIGSAISVLTNSPLKLGGVGFAGMEIPERMPFGGKQKTARKVLIGGQRILQAQGPEEDNVTWTGRFTGPNCMARATTLDSMRQNGLPVSLVWGNKNLLVLVIDFKADYEILYQIPYSITCEIITAFATAPSFLNTPVTALVGSDVSSALGLSNIIGNATIGTTLVAAQSTLAALGTLTGSSVLGQAGAAIGTAQGAANVVAAAGNASVQGIAIGIANVAGSLPTAVATKLSAAASNSASLANAAAIATMLTRAQRNIAGAM